jgi:hypothetical protein
LLRNAQKRDNKTKPSKTIEVEKKTEEKKPNFVMSPDGRWTFWGETIIVFFISPCYETPKNAIKKTR